MIFDKCCTNDRISAIKFAETEMLNRICYMGSFADKDCIGDWFMIGGRWSGNLTILKLGDKYTQSLKDIGVNDNTPRTEEVNQKLRMQWASLGQNGTHPFLRDPYLKDGPYADDAAIIDKTIFENIKDMFG